MKKNRGVTLVELIIVLSSLTLVFGLIWTVLSSSTENSHTITDKVAVQTSVTSLMNIIQQDIQEARIINISRDGAKGIIIKIDENKYVFNTSYKNDDTIEYGNNTIEYAFDSELKTVTRTKGQVDSLDKAIYNDITSFSMNMIFGEKFGAEIKITGGKEKGPLNSEADDKSRFELSSTYYTRNTR